MSAVRKPVTHYVTPGTENFLHGAETYRKRRREIEARENRQDALNANLNVTTMHHEQCGTWSSSQLKELWRLRYERKPKYTYDMLAKRFRRANTWDIVNALCELQNRKHAGSDMWKPIEGPSREASTKPVIVKTKRKPYKLDEKTQDYCRLKGAGYSNKEIADMYGCSRENVRKRLHKMEKERSDEYARLLAEGQQMKRPERS